MSGKILNPRVSNFPRPESKFNSRGDRTKIRPPASPALFPVFDTAPIRSVPTSPKFRNEWPSVVLSVERIGEKGGGNIGRICPSTSSFATSFDSFTIYRFASKSLSSLLSTSSSDGIFAVNLTILALEILFSKVCKYRIMMKFEFKRGWVIDRMTKLLVFVITKKATEMNMEMKWEGEK